MVAKVSLQTSRTQEPGPSSLVVSDHRQTAAHSVGEIITIVRLYPFSVLPPHHSFVARLAGGGFLRKPRTEG